MPTLINADMLDTSPPEWTVDGIIPRVGIGFMHGPSRAGKSLVADTELALAISNGTPFFGCETVTGCVVVALGEGLYDAGVRLEGRLARQARDNEDMIGKLSEEERDAAREKLPVYDSERLFMMTAPFTIPVRADGRPSDGLAHAVAQLRVIPDLELIVVDAMSDFSGGLSISNDASANRYVLGLKHMARELDCVVLVVAHNTADDRKMIGAQRFFNAGDFVIEVIPDDVDPGEPSSSTIMCRKSKYGPGFEPISYVVEPLQWETENEDGELVTIRSATVRMQGDGQATGGHPALRLPGQGTAGARELPDVRPVPVQRKRTGIKRGTVQTRESLVSTLMSVPCPCGAEPGENCPEDGAERSLLAESTYAHTKRIVVALRSGAVTVAQVVAQFGDSPPAGLGDPLTQETRDDVAAATQDMPESEEFSELEGFTLTDLGGEEPEPEATKELVEKDAPLLVLPAPKES